MVRALIDELPVDGRWTPVRDQRHRAHLAERGHDVTGVDGSPEMLELARSHVPNARFLEGDLHALPVDDCEFDLAVCALALSHIERVTRPLPSSPASSAPGGTIVVSDLHPVMSVAGGAGAL